MKGQSPPKISNALRALLAESPPTLVLTGAGVSQESGVPTFRGAGGLWRDHRPEDLATPEAFRRNPRLVWEWYRWRRGIVSAAVPNAGHVALARMERLMPWFLIATQNVDGLHQMAGSRRVVELHGNIMRTRCSSCGSALPEPRPGAREPASEAAGGVPRCTCGGLGRPDVVWFGENLALSAVDEVAAAAAVARLVLVVGTSAVVYPAAAFAKMGKASGAHLAVVNPEETPLLSVADDWIPDTAASALPEIAALVAGEGAPPPAARRLAAAKPRARSRRG